MQSYLHTCGDDVIVAVRMSAEEWKLVHKGIGATPPIDLAMRMFNAKDNGPTNEHRRVAMAWYGTLYSLRKQA